MATAIISIMRAMETVRPDYTGRLALLDKKISNVASVYYDAILRLTSGMRLYFRSCGVRRVNLIPDCEKLMSSGDCLIVQQVIERTFK
jgi:hypothetical protein